MPISPNRGSTGGGTTVTITSTTAGALTNTSRVLFGTKDATNVVYNAIPDNVTCTSPSGLGVVDCKVVLTGGATSNGVSFFYVGGATKSGLSDSVGPTGGGNSVTITGSGLSTTSGVTFGANAATVTSANDGAVTVTVPAGAAAGSVPVTVTTAAGSFNGLNYTYVDPPGTLTPDPTSGSTSGGNAVTITATGNVSTTSQVTFDGVAVPFSVDSANDVSVIAPAHAAGAVAVALTTEGGTSTAPGAYTYVSLQI
jgi:hypothetical protein